MRKIICNPLRSALARLFYFFDMLTPRHGILAVALACSSRLRIRIVLDALLAFLLPYRANRPCDPNLVA